MSKKTIIKITFLAIIILLFPITTFAWDDCPYGKEDDPYPGDCARYVDTDNDGICDHSQPAPEDRVPEVTNSESEGSNEAGSLQNESAEDNVALPSKNDTDSSDTDVIVKDETKAAVNGTSDKELNNSERSYYLIPISLVLILLYLLSYILSKTKVIGVATHRKIWNLILLITFLASGILGIILVININFNLLISLPFNILFWHVGAGIAMFVISIFHIIWHWRYFINMFKFGKK